MAKGNILSKLGHETTFSTAMGILILRLGFGGTMLVAHGWSKLTGFGEKGASS